MFKLVDFLAKKKKVEKQGKKLSTSELEKEKVNLTQLNKKEKQEIRATLRGFQGSEAHAILMKQLEEADLAACINDQSDEDSYDSGTFCVKSTSSLSSSTNSEENYGTFCVNSTGGGDDDGGYDSGTFNLGSSTESSPSNSNPNFANMFREPEDWEKCILALEKGEWTDEMQNKGAFKRWKKERPAMPSTLMKNSPIPAGMFEAPKGKGK